MGFRWERCFLMSRSLDTICPPLVQAELEVRELSLVDYDNALWQGYLTEERRRLYEERFNEKKAKAYGVFVDGTLACSAWILYGKVILMTHVPYYSMTIVFQLLEEKGFMVI